MFRVVCIVAVSVAASPSAAMADQPDDPSRDCIGLTPTAWTMPAGTWSITSVMIAFARLAVAPHRRWSFELAGIIPNTGINAGGPAVSFLIHESENVRVIARADGAFAIDHDTTDGLRPMVNSFMVRRRATAGGLGVIGGACLEPTCRASASLGLRGGWSEIDDVGYPETSATLALFVPIARPLLFGHGRVDMCNRMSGCYGLEGEVGGGVRFAGTRWSLTLGWIKSLAQKQDDVHISDLTPAGSPWFSVTYLRP